MIHVSKNGDVIGSFDAPQGHGMDVDSQGFVYIGQDTVRKYDPKTGKVVAEVARVPETEGGGPPGGRGAEPRVPGRGGRGPVSGFLGRGGGSSAEGAARGGGAAAFRAKYPATTPMIVGGIEEIRIDEPNNDIYVADSYLGGRVMVFDFKTLAFKRGWGAYGRPLSEVSTNDADRAYTPGGPMPKEFRASHDQRVERRPRVRSRSQREPHSRHDARRQVPQGIQACRADRRRRRDRWRRVLTGQATEVPVISDLTNNHVYFLDRESGKEVGRMGSMGESGGSFWGLHMIAVIRRGTSTLARSSRVSAFSASCPPTVRAGRSSISCLARGYSRRVNSRYRGLIVAAALAAFPIVLGAQSSATDWPQFRGPNRDGVAASFSIPTAWPEQLTRVWKADVVPAIPRRADRQSRIRLQPADDQRGHAGARRGDGQGDLADAVRRPRQRQSSRRGTRTRSEVHANVRRRPPLHTRDGRHRDGVRCGERQADCGRRPPATSCRCTERRCHRSWIAVS